MVAGVGIYVTVVGGLGGVGWGGVGWEGRWRVTVPRLARTAATGDRRRRDSWHRSDGGEGRANVGGGGEEDGRTDDMRQGHQPVWRHELTTWRRQRRQPRVTDGRLRRASSRLRCNAIKCLWISVASHLYKFSTDIFYGDVQTRKWTNKSNK